MRCLTFGVALLALAVRCRCIEILIDENPTNRTQFCAGERLTLVCRNDTEAYAWIVPGIQSQDNTLFVQSSRASVTVDGFTATFVNSITSTLEFNVKNDINGITITCSQLIGSLFVSAIDMDVYETSVMMCPGSISAVGNDCSSINATMRNISMCTKYINATTVRNQDIQLSVDNRDQVLSKMDFVISDPTLEVCSMDYNVNFTAVFFDGTTMQCDSVAVDQLPTPSADSLTTTSTVTTASTSDSATTPTTTRGNGNGAEPSGLSQTTIIIIVVVVVGVLLIVAIIIGIIIIRKCVQKCNEQPSNGKPEAYDEFKPHQPDPHKQPDPHDQLPTYQDPQAIQREEAPDGAMYSMIEKKGKGSKKKSEKKEEMPMYSVVDKNNKDPNSQEGLVYTEVSVQNTSRSSRSRPPPPPGVAQLDANEPVLYSTVETPQQRQ